MEAPDEPGQRMRRLIPRFIFSDRSLLRFFLELKVD